MRALMAIVLYGLAAVAGLAAGYFATAPASAHERPRAGVERRAAAPAYADELAEMEAAARFLAEEERRAADAAVPASAEL
jgi:hypothetical protein